MKKINKNLLLINFIMIALLSIGILVGCGGNGKKVSEIEANYDANTPYYIGESMKSTTIDVTYSDDTSEEVAVTADMVYGFDTSVAGEKTVIIKYMEKTCEMTINVKDIYLTELQIPNDYNNRYYKNEEFRVFTATAKYSNGSSKNIEINQNNIDGFNTAQLGSKKYSINLEGKSFSVDINVEEVKLVSIAIKSTTVKNYTQGDSFKGVTIVASYENGEDKDVVLNSIAQNILGFTTESIGTVTITVNYQEKEASYQISVVKGITSFEVTGKKTYLRTDTFDVTTSLHIVYTDGLSETVPVTETMLTGFSTEVKGNKEVSIAYNGYIFKYNIVVEKLPSDPVDEKIEMEVNDSRITYEGTNAIQPQIVNGSDTKSNGVHLESFNQIGSKVTIKYHAETAGVFDLKLRAQSCSKQGRNAQNMSDVCGITLNGGAQFNAIGTVGKATTSDTAWTNMNLWYEVTIAENLRLVEGDNTITLTVLKYETSIRFPNIDTFIINIIG